MPSDIPSVDNDIIRCINDVHSTAGAEDAFGIYEMIGWYFPVQADVAETAMRCKFYIRLIECTLETKKNRWLIALAGVGSDMVFWGGSGLE